MWTRSRVIGVVLVCVLMGCPPSDDGDPTDLLRGPFEFLIEPPARTTPAQPAEKLAELDAVPDTVRFDALGDKRQLKIIGRYSTGRTVDLTAGSSGSRYSTRNESVATVSGDGQITSTGAGETTVEVTNGDRSVRVAVIVKFPEKPAERLDNLRVAPATLFFARAGQSRRLEVRGTYSTGRTAYLTARATGTEYASNDPGVARVDGDGLVTAVKAGETRIRVDNGGRSAEVPVTVRQTPPPPPPDPVLTGLRVSPSEITLTAIEAAQALNVTGDYSDGDERNLTADVATSYESLSPGIASVSATGIVMAVGNGVTQVVAAHGGFVAEARVTVVIPAPDVVELLAQPDVIVFTDPGEKVQLRIEGRFSNGDVRDLTDSTLGTTYSVDDLRVAAVSAFGEVSPVAGGMATLTVSNGALAIDLPIDVQYCLPLTPSIDALPQRVNTAVIAVSGVCEPGCTVEVFGPGGVVTALSTDGIFDVDAPLASNRVNDLYVTAIAPCGARSAPITVFVTQDSTPPVVRIDFPTDGAEFTTETVDVSGRVSDVLSGYQGLEVLVNGQVAAVNVGIGTNGTFFLPDLPLPTAGSLRIEAVAADGLGNASGDAITVTRVAIPPGTPQMQIVSGNAQSAVMHGLLAEPLRVRLLRPDGVTPFAGKVVTFEVTRSDGRLALAAEGDGALMCQAHTDAQGIAEVFWRVGADAGQGNNRVRVSSTDIAGTIFFCASTLAGPPVQINVGAGNFQRVEIRGTAAEPLRVWVSDGCNGIPNVPVLFSASGGLVNGAPQVTVLTGASGHVEVRYTAGAEPTVETVSATYPGNQTGAAVFTIYTVRRDLDAPTTFIGEVRDNSGLALGGAGLRLLIAGVEVGTAVSGDDGDFEIIANDPTLGGAADLYVDASTIDSINGEPVPAVVRFPDMHYELAVVPNVVNRWMSEILLPRIASVNDRVFTGGQPDDLELACDGIEGLRFIVRAGTTVTLADGTVIGPGNPGQAILAINQVHTDEIPMAMPDGAAPPFAWTFQPGGTRFDPPVQVELPNMSGLPAGSIVNFLSFDHDTNRFEIVATGHAGADGIIRSDPDSGITLSGWGGLCPPYSVTGSVGKCGIRINGPTIVRVGAPVTYQARLTLPKPINWTGGQAVGPRSSTTYTTIFTEPGDDVVGASACGQSKFIAVKVLPDCEIEITDFRFAGCTGEEFFMKARVDCNKPGRFEWSVPEGDPPSGVGAEFRTRFSSYGVKEVNLRYVRDDGIAAGALSEFVEVRNELEGATASPGTNLGGSQTILRSCVNKPVVLTPSMRCGELDSDAVVTWSCATATPEEWIGPDYPVVFNYAGLNFVEVTYQPADGYPQSQTLEVRIGECGGQVREERLCYGHVSFEMEDDDIPIRTVEWFLPEAGGNPVLGEGLEWQSHFCEPGDYPLVATITDACDQTCVEERTISIGLADICPIDSIVIFPDDQIGVANPGAYFIIVSSICRFSEASPVLEAPGAEVLAEGPFVGDQWLFHVRYCETGDKPVRITYDVPGCGIQYCTFERSITVAEANLCQVVLFPDSGDINGLGGIFDLYIQDGSTVIQDAEIRVSPPTDRWRLVEQDAVSTTIQLCDPGDYEVSGLFTSQFCEQQCESNTVELTARADQLCILQGLGGTEAVPGSGNWTFEVAGFFPPDGRILWQVCNGASQDLPAGEQAHFFLDPTAKPRYYVTATLTTEFCGNTCSASIAVPDCGVGYFEVEVDAIGRETYTFSTDLPGDPPVQWRVYRDGVLADNAVPNTAFASTFTTAFCEGGAYEIEAMANDPPCESDCVATRTIFNVPEPICDLFVIEQQVLSQTVDQITVRFTLPEARNDGPVSWRIDGVEVGTTPDVATPFDYTFQRGCDNKLMTARLTTRCGLQCDETTLVDTGLCQVGAIAAQELDRSGGEVQYRFTLPNAVGDGTVLWRVGVVIVATGLPVTQPFDYTFEAGCKPVLVRADLTVAGCNEPCQGEVSVTPCPDAPIEKTLDLNRLTVTTPLCAFDNVAGVVQWSVSGGRAEPATGQSPVGPGHDPATFSTVLCDSGDYVVTATGPSGCQSQTTLDFIEDPGVFCFEAQIWNWDDPDFETPTTRRLGIGFIELPPADGSVQWYIDGALRASLPSKQDLFYVDLNKGQTYAVRAVLTTPCDDSCEVNDVIVVVP